MNDLEDDIRAYRLFLHVLGGMAIGVPVGMVILTLWYT